MTDYNNQLQALREKLARKSKVESMLSSLQAQLTDLKAEEQRLANIRMNEQTDVDRLEKPSLASFFYTVISRKDEKLEQEKAEAYAAAVKHEVAVHQVETVEHDIRSMEAELSEYSETQSQYDKVFAQKEAAVKQSDSAHAAELYRMEDRLGYLSAQIKEMDEALSVGRAALSQISAVEQALGSAEGWGTWDLLGGGLISDLAKHAHLDDAQAQISELQDTLRRYRTELSDVTIHADIQVQIEGFLRFADYFFDGLFADWTVLNSIHSSQEQISTTRSQVEGIQRRLEEMKRNLALETEKLKTQRNDIVLNA